MYHVDISRDRYVIYNKYIKATKQQYSFHYNK